MHTLKSEEEYFHFTLGTCEDDSTWWDLCPYWASIGLCSKKQNFMSHNILVVCKKTCNACGGK